MILLCILCKNPFISQWKREPRPYYLRFGVVPVGESMKMCYPAVCELCRGGNNA